MNKLKTIFNNNELLLEILDDSKCLRYITPEMKALKCTSRSNYLNVNKAIKTYIHNYQESMYNVFSNKYLLLNIFLYIYDIMQYDNQESIKNNIFSAFNKSSIMFKNSSKLFNILSRKTFCFILNNDKTLNSKFCYIKFSSTDILLQYYIEQYSEFKEHKIQIQPKLCKNGCYREANIFSSYCKIHESFYIKNRYNGSKTYFRVCKACGDNLISSNNEHYNKYTYCSTKCNMKAKRNRKLKMPPNFMTEPILSIDDINKHFSDMKI